jgi:hypothetical protein
MDLIVFFSSQMELKLKLDRILRNEVTIEIIVEDGLLGL